MRGDATVNNDVTPTETQNFSHLSNLPKSVPTSRTISSNPNCNDWIGSKSMNLEARLEVWIVAYCHDKDSRKQQVGGLKQRVGGLKQRVGGLNAIFRDIYTDHRFWQYRHEGNRDYYEDALCLMWRYFVLNLCEVETARTSGSFLKTRTYAVGRLLKNLEGHLKNIQERRQKEFSRQKKLPFNEDGAVVDPLDEVPSPKPELASRQFKAFLHLLETDPEGELNHEDNTLCGRDKAYTLTAQTYLLMRYRDGKTIQQIAHELNIPEGSLQSLPRQTQWKELARKYAQQAIDSVSE
jgi:hypothetical protein